MKRKGKARGTKLFSIKCFEFKKSIKSNVNVFKAYFVQTEIFYSTPFAEFLRMEYPRVLSLTKFKYT